MENIDTIKTKAIRAVKNDGRLIADVAQEFGISRRKLYRWLSDKRPQSNSKNTRKAISSDVSTLKSKLELLQTEVQQLKKELRDYQITETLDNGRLILKFKQRSLLDHELKKTG